MRAKAGVQVGDIQKEAHMAFQLAELNMQNNNNGLAAKFFKRFFFCARMLDDPIGASIALNRIGVAYYKHKKYMNSLKFHEKHMEFTDKENVFASYYNMGICHRVMNNYATSVDYFTKALEWS